MINRAALIVRPAEPYIAWAKGLDDSGAAPDPAGEQTVYLVPQVSDAEGIEQMLTLVHEEVFIRELYAWHTDEEDWPEDLTLAAFRKWFHIEVHTVVEDFGLDPVEDGEDEDDDLIEEVIDGIV